MIQFSDAIIVGLREHLDMHSLLPRLRVQFLVQNRANMRRFLPVVINGSEVFSGLAVPAQGTSLMFNLIPPSVVHFDVMVASLAAKALRHLIKDLRK
jgi:hypothetical protein